MAEVQCPYPGCEYKTADLDVAIVAVAIGAALVTAHSATQVAALPPAPLAAKVERVQRPTITATGTSEDWAYFKSRRKDYVEATKVAGRGDEPL